MAKKIAIFGATSEIGGEIARMLAPGNHLVLAGRRTTNFAEELYNLGATQVDSFFFDATDVDSHASLIAEIEATGPLERRPGDVRGTGRPRACRARLR